MLEPGLVYLQVIPSPFSQRCDELALETCKAEHTASLLTIEGTHGGGAQSVLPPGQLQRRAILVLLQMTSAQPTFWLAIFQAAHGRTWLGAKAHPQDRPCRRFLQQQP